MKSMSGALSGVVKRPLAALLAAAFVFFLAAHMGYQPVARLFPTWFTHQWDNGKGGVSWASAAEWSCLFASCYFAYKPKQK